MYSGGMSCISSARSATPGEAVGTGGLLGEAEAVCTGGVGTAELVAREEVVGVADGVAGPGAVGLQLLTINEPATRTLSRADLPMRRLGSCPHGSPG